MYNFGCRGAPFLNSFPPLTINKSLNHHCNFHKGILSKESADLIQKFFQEKRAKKNRT